MAIVSGDTIIVDIPVYNAAGFSVLPAPPLKGRALNVDPGVDCGILWEDGKVAGDVPVSLLKKLTAGSGSFTRGKIYRFATNAQELTGVLTDAFVAEADNGAQTAFVILSLTGRGEGAPPAYAIISCQVDFGNIPALLQEQPTAKFPRY